MNHLRQAAEDFRYLLNRRFPRKGSLELVGDHYQLTRDERHLLHRGVFSDEDSLARRGRKVPASRVRGMCLLVDGYNVIITIEAGLSGRPLIHADDGFIRDISGLSGNFRASKKTVEALGLIFATLHRITPGHTLFLFDSPISKSGEMAAEVRRRLIGEHLPGDARAENVPEKTLLGGPGIVATSDTAVIDQTSGTFDLAGYILKGIPVSKPFFRFSPVRRQRPK